MFVLQLQLTTTERGKTMREEYYRYLGEIPPRQRSLSAIPAKYVSGLGYSPCTRPERIIDTEIMEPSVASPRRSMGEKADDKDKQKENVSFLLRISFSRKMII